MRLNFFQEIIKCVDVDIMITVVYTTSINPLLKPHGGWSKMLEPIDMFTNWIQNYLGDKRQRVMVL